MESHVFNDFGRAIEIVRNKLINWAEKFIEMVPNFMLAFLILVIFFFIARISKKAIFKIHPRVDRNDTLVRLAGTTAFVFILIVGLFVALSVLQLNQAVTSLLAGAGIIGITLGLAFQETTSNFLASVIMAFRKPILIGELVESNGKMGYVIEVNLRATFILGLNGETFIIPNRQILYNPITNYTRSGSRRVELNGRVSYHDNLQSVIDIATETLNKLPNRDPSQPVYFWFTNFGESAIDFVAQVWMNQTGQVEYLQFKSETIVRLKSAFKDHGIHIPFPIRTLDFAIQGGQRISDMPLQVNLDSSSKKSDSNLENKAN